MGIGQALPLPLFFAGNAIYPITLMPTWLKVIALINAVTYEVGAQRTLLLAGGVSTLGMGLVSRVLTLTAIVLILIGSRLNRRVVA